MEFASFIGLFSILGGFVASFIAITLAMPPLGSPEHRSIALLCGAAAFAFEGVGWFLLSKWAKQKRRTGELPLIHAMDTVALPATAAVPLVLLGILASYEMSSHRISFLVGWAVLIAALWRLRQERLMSALPHHPIATAASGEVVLEGVAQSSEALVAPLSQTPCVYYRYLIEEMEQTDHRTSWRTLAEGESGDVPFTVQDGTGTITVHPHGAKWVLPETHQFSRDFFRVLSAKTESFLKGKGLAYQNWKSQQKKVRAREWLLLSGQSVVVMGTAMSAAKSAAVVNAAPIKSESICYIAAQENFPYVISTKRLIQTASTLRWHAFALLATGLALVFYSCLPVLERHLQTLTTRL